MHAPSRNRLFPAWVLPLVLAAGLTTALVLAFFIAPREAQMGEVQRIFYFHVASAFAALIGWVGCAIASLGFLLLANRPSQTSLAKTIDRLAHALGEVGVLFGAIVLITGPLWAKPVWKAYWTWEPRLVLMLLTQFLFIGYLVLRAYAKQDLAGKKLAAGIAVIGGPAVYLIQVAVELWGGNHPQVVSGEGGGLQHPDMQLAFAVAVFAILAFAAYIVHLRMERHRLDAEVEELHLELDDLEDAATPRPQGDR
ncbi:MAG TPA: cytochrome c biogenesis protein CcsA [Myxococcota bacterium]|nr:cytochrome c biogenesis protein CcsA [Myxococcota bacterium]